MFIETKVAVRKTIEVCKILFFMSQEDYNKLIEETQKIIFPTAEEINSLSYQQEEAASILLKEKYKRAALNIGLDEKYGLAILEYLSLLEDSK
jgi:TRAP-type C4-dicarboxylate transport system substrate-binding protein